MNKSYRSIWNEATGAWVAVQENAVARGKKKSSRRALVALAAAGAGTAGFVLPGSAWADICASDSYGSKAGYRSIGTDTTCASWNGSTGDGEVPGAAQFTAIGLGGTQLVVSSTKQSIIFMPSNGSVKATMTTGANGVLLSGLTAGLGTSDAINVSQLTPVISALGGGATFNTYTGAVTGPSYTLANANSITGASSSSSQSTVGGAFNEVDAALGQLQTQISKLPLVDAVTYDSSSHSKVTLAGSDHVPVALTNVANGALNASSLDAVNGSQLNATNQNLTNLSGNVTTINGQITNINGKLADAVMYDSSAHSKVTLGGVGSTTAVALTNVANGALNASSLDAVNGSQLNATNQNLTNLSGNVTTINGQITNINGKLADAVMYDSSAHNKVTLGGVGSTTAVALTNVANGALNASSLDAVNGSQLNATNQNLTNLSGNVTNIAGDITNIKGKLADAVMYDSSAHNKVTLGGVGSTTAVALTNVANGALNASSLDAVNGSQLNATNQNLTNLSGNVTNIAGDITNIKGKLADAVTYDSSAHNKVTLGGVGSTTAVALTNVANGALNASSLDAVNGSQLNATNQNLTSLAGNVTNIAGDITNIKGKLADAVTYDTSAHDMVTLGGVGSTTAVALTNVAPGAVTASSLDAVNGTQLYNLASSTADAMGGGSTANGDGSISAPTYNIGGKTYNNAGDTFTALYGDITSINGTIADAVVYDSSAHDKVTLGGVDSSTTVALTNVANGALSAASVDAVNGSQLYALGATTDASGNITNAFVAYDDTSKSKVTLGGVDSGTPVALTNVAAGAVTASSLDAVNGTQLYNLASSTADAMGGGSTANGDGSISAPTYNIGGKTYNNAGDTFTALYGDITSINGTIADAVVYDSSAHDKVTLGGVGSTTPVGLTNVANGGLTASSVDAVNGSQLYALGATTDASGNITNAFVAYDDTSKSSVTLGGVGTSTGVALHNVKAGAVNASSLDAVNGTQLYGLASSTAQALGGKTQVNADGSIGAPTYILSDHTYNDVGTALDAVMAAAVSGNVDGVIYDSTAHTKVTFGGQNATSTVLLTNLTNGTLTASSSDAVNGSQLYALGATTDASGNINNAFVAYDDKSLGKVTLGGSDHAAVTLTNVAAGAVTESSLDAVNGTQLYNLASSTADAMGGGSTANGDGSISAPTYNIGGKTYNNAGDTFTALYGDITSINGTIADAVVYDTSAHDKVTLGGVGSTTPVALTNVANGGLTGSSLDAVNGSQLYALGATTNASGNITNAFVAYDDTSKNSVTFGGSDHAAVQLHNVAVGAVSASSLDAVNGTQLYGLASSTAKALGGETQVNADGSISSPDFVLQGNNYTDVGSALKAVMAAAVSGNVDGVIYDSSAHNSVTLGGADHVPVALTNVANGALTASSSDAVNGSQLYALGATTDASGNINNAFVAYDDKSKSKVTLGGAGSTTPVALTNVANGALSAASVDAVNGSQLYALGARTDASGNLLNAFVAYDDTSMNSVTFGGSGHAPVVLHNVANGVASNDAVNVAQLEAMGAIIDNSGNVTNAFVAYDDSTKSSVTLGGLAASAPVQLHNVANGVVSASSHDAVNGGQLYGVASSTASALGGGSTVNADGSISAPAYVLNGGTFNDVGSAISNVDGRVTNIENTVTNIAGQVANAVQYDSSAHDKITLGGTSATTAVALTNVANGTLSADSLDAVNGSQLYATNQDVANLTTQIQNINVNGSEYLSTNTTNGAASATGTNSIAAGGGAIASGANSTAIGDKASATGNNSVALGANSVASEDNTVSVGSEGNERRITNVANGVNPTDAANMGQLQSGLNALQSNVNSVARTAYSGVAAATALTMIPDVDQGKTIAVGVGTANFQGYQAVALGASARITQNLKVKLGGGYGSSGGATFGGGMSYQW